MEECHRTQDAIVETELARMAGGGLRAFRKMWQRAMKTRGVRYAWWKLVETPMYRWKGPDWAPVLRYRLDQGWVMEQ